jgi:hypothetical protein
VESHLKLKNTPSIFEKARFSGVLLGFVLIFSACNSNPQAAQQQSQQQPEEVYVANEQSVGFDIQPVPIESPGTAWLATYTAKGKTAKFRIEFRKKTAINEKDLPDFDIEEGDGKIISEPGSDAQFMLVELQRVLEAKKFPAKIQRAESLPFTFISLGRNESRYPDGSFGAKPPGNWTPAKLFIGGDEGEVFLNINPVLRKGEFSIKDPDYGDFVLAQLARVL